MANVSHATLAGADLHEPKGVGAAATGQVYISDGGGSGAWTTIVGLSFTGMIADFLTPSAPSGWLELDGSAISSTTYAALYSVMTVQQTGVRTGGSAIITTLASTANIKAGYSVIGTGITAGTTVLSVDSFTQITMSANANSSGTSTVIVSPWVLGSGTITLPDTTTAGRYRRSRTSSTILGTVQSSQNLAHTHTGTSDASGAHTHTATTDAGGVHNHNVNGATNFFGGTTSSNITPSGAASTMPLGVAAISIDNSSSHTHTLTTASSSTHTHTFTSASSGSTEARPVSIVVLTCVKT